ncbi:MAG: lysylphosphatidylglycerol synthase domain-containing protein [Gemmatimonadales bacterium]|nr:lysylphosphatidylglycerol synthase domain-containing protein [Gemmatimonadales bacterium]
MGSGSWRLLRTAIGTLVVALAVRSLVRQWDTVRAQGIEWHLDWLWIAESLLLTWLMYLGLVWGWRKLIIAWGESLPFWRAVRIWLLASLGRYIPGKVWALLGLAVLAKQEGVSGTTAMGSAIVMQLLALMTGGAVAVGFLGGTLLDQHLPGGVLAAVGLASVALLASALVTSQPVMRWFGCRIGRAEAVRAIRPGQLVMAVIPNLLAWLGYGLALLWLARGTIGETTMGWPLATGAFTASYLAGYLFLFAPGGIGVRESVLILLLQPTIGLGQAIALAAASRLALTINELGVALPLFLLGRTSRDDA